MRDNEETVWLRMALAAVAILVVLAISAIAIASAPGYLSPKAIEHPPVSPVISEKTTPESASHDIPAWPEEVPENVPGIPPGNANSSSTPILIPEFNESAPGVRDNLQYFTIHRDNVSGNKDLTIKTTVYGWREFYQITWRNDYLGKYLDQVAPNGEKYVFVFLSEYIDGDTPEKDSRAWYFGPNQFRLQVDGRLFSQDPDFSPDVRIQELEEIEGYNGIKGLDPFGFLVTQDLGSGHVSAEPDPWLKMGKSNAKDGFLVYRVPLDATDMMLVGSFGSWGDAAWRLT